MKPLKYHIFTLLAAGLLLTHCEPKEFDAPPHDEPQYKGKASITIKDFKAKYAASNLIEITDNDTITGIVTANDESGNLYKQLFIQDETGGLMIAINETYLYNSFPVGQQVFIETKGLYMGKYGGMPQLGYKYSRNNDDNYTIGQVPWIFFEPRIHRHGYPSRDAAVPQVISFDEFTPDNLGRLVTLEGVSFADAGKVYAYPDEANNVQTINRVIYSYSNSSKTVTGRMSSAADFAADIIPSGVGKVTGILTVFQSGSSNTYQFLMRNKQDADFTVNPDGWGIQESPWSVPFALANQNTGKSGWVKGYIVGSIQPGVNDTNPIDSNDDIDFEAPFALGNYVLIAENASERDYTKCILVNLPADSDLRKYVNLVDHPENIGKELIITGSLQGALGSSGIKNATGDVSEFVFGNIGKVILNADFASSLSPFTAVSVTGSQEWTYDAYGYAKMTGYVNPTNYANEDWLISPAMDLTSLTAANVSFSHVSRYGTNVTDLTLWATDNYTGGAPNSATWTQIAISNYSSGTSWTDWTSSGNLNIPTSYMGKTNVRIAFKYLSSTSRAGTWEVKGLVVKGGEGETTDPGTDPGTGDDLLSATFASTLSPFTEYSLLGTQAWAHDSYGYAKMTGYVNPTNYENEDWLISPAINLTTQTAAYVTFDHVSRYTTSNTNDLTLWISDNFTGGSPQSASWTQIAINKYSSGTSWTDWTNSGKLSIPSAFIGKNNVYIALKYLSTASAAGTWEIKNLYVKSGLGDDPGTDPGTGGDGTQLFLETFGTGTHTTLETRPKIGDFTGYDNTTVTYTDASTQATIRSTTTLNAHVWLPANNDSYLTISGIDASAYENVKLQFDFTGNGATNSEKLIIKINDVAITVPSVAASTANSFVNVAIPEALAVSGTFKLEFVSLATNNTVGFRIDNIKLTGTAK